MFLYPTMNLLGGRSVRLEQGDLGRSTAFDDDPEEVADSFAKQGADCIQIVDLDGARVGQPRQHALIARIAARVPVQAGGGFRSEDDVAAMLDAGARRIAISSLALTDPDLVTALFNRFGPDRILLALDVRVVGGKAMVSSHGWIKSSGRDIDEVLDRFPFVRHVLITDIGRSGMMNGPNLALVKRVVTRYPDLLVQSAGGVGTLDHLDRLREAGADAAAVGMPIWQDVFTVADAVERAHRA